MFARKIYDEEGSGQWLCENEYLKNVIEAQSLEVKWRRMVWYRRGRRTEKKKKKEKKKGEEDMKANFLTSHRVIIFMLSRQLLKP